LEKSKAWADLITEFCRATSSFVSMIILLTQFRVEEHVDGHHALILKDTGILKTYVNDPLNIDSK